MTSDFVKSLVFLDYYLFQKCLLMIGIELFPDEDGYTTYEMKLETLLQTMALSEGHTTLQTDMTGNTQPMHNLEARLFGKKRDGKERVKQDSKAMVPVSGGGDSDEESSSEEEVRTQRI